MAINPWIFGSGKSRPSNEKRKDKEGAAKKGEEGLSQSGLYMERFLPSSPSKEPQRRPEQGVSFKDRFLQGREKEPGYQEKTEPKEPVKEPKVLQAGELLEKLIAKRNSMPETEMLSLSKKAEKQLSSNLTELSLIEGNLMGIGQDLTTFYCTSCFRGEGKTTAAVNAAFGLSVYGRRNVLLIDSNSDAPYVHRFFGASNEQGFQGILNNTVSAEDAIIPTGYERLYLLPAGEGDMSLFDERLKKNLETFKENFDFVLIDGKSLLASSEASNVAPAVDGFLLVVECEKTKWDVVQLAQGKLRQAGVQHIGIVLNKRRYYVPSAAYRLLSKR